MDAKWAVKYHVLFVIDLPVPLKVCRCNKMSLIGIQIFDTPARHESTLSKAHINCGSDNFEKIYVHPSQTIDPIRGQCVRDGDVSKLFGGGGKKHVVSMMRTFGLELEMVLDITDFALVISFYVGCACPICDIFVENIYCCFSNAQDSDISEMGRSETIYNNSITHPVNPGLCVYVFFVPAFIFAGQLDT